MTTEEFTLRSETLGALPVINHFLARMGLDDIIERHLPANDARLRLDPATVIGVVVRNLAIDHRPIYALSEWAAPFDPGLLGLAADGAAALNDDRVGRMLDRFFDADRASLITEIVLSSVREFDVALDQLHYDSTTVTRHHLTDHTGRVIQVFEPALSDLQHQVLALLGIPPNTYQTTPPGGR